MVEYFRYHSNDSDEYVQRPDQIVSLSPPYCYPTEYLQDWRRPEKETTTIERQLRKHVQIGRIHILSKSLSTSEQWHGHHFKGWCRCIKNKIFEDCIIKCVVRCRHGWIIRRSRWNCRNSFGIKRYSCAVIDADRQVLYGKKWRGREIKTAE